MSPLGQPVFLHPSWGVCLSLPQMSVEYTGVHFVDSKCELPGLHAVSSWSVSGASGLDIMYTRASWDCHRLRCTGCLAQWLCTSSPCGRLETLCFQLMREKKVILQCLFRRNDHNCKARTWVVQNAFLLLWVGWNQSPSLCGFSVGNWELGLAIRVHCSVLCGMMH